MMAVRERAVKVMAALERRVPSLDDFVGQSWSAWAERAGVTTSEGKGVLCHRYRPASDRSADRLGFIFVETNGSLNHVTQTKTLLGPSAGRVTCCSLSQVLVHTASSIKISDNRVY